MMYKLVNKLFQNTRYYLILLSLGSIFSLSAQAAIINTLLGSEGATNGTSVTINGADFTVAPDNTGAGSGNFNSFLRTQALGTSTIERGFNTDAPPPLDAKPGPFTHSVQIGDIQIDSGKFELILDIGELGGDPGALISMTELELWIHTIPNDADYSDGLGVMIWDLDSLEDNTLNLDYDILSGGNGKYDIVATFDASLFTGYDSSSYFYLYNEFGCVTEKIRGVITPPDGTDDCYFADSTYEEWAFTEADGDMTVPEPSIIALFAAGLFGLGFARRRKHS